MRPSWLAGSLISAVSLIVPAARGQDAAPPPLTAPSEAGPIAVPPPAAPTAPVTPLAPPRPKPDLLRPRAAVSPPSRPTLPRLEPPIPAGDEELPPPLDAPAEMRMTERAANPGRSAIVSTPRGEGPPSLVLEPGDERGMGLEGARSKLEPEKIRPELPPQNPKKPRRFGLFPQVGAPRSRPTPPPDETIRIEPRNDPAADAALKRRLEAKVVAAVGDKARDVEVRVVDRNVFIKAKVDRFWNRRAVRKTIESLPALSGYRAKVDVGD